MQINQFFSLVDIFILNVILRLEIILSNVIEMNIIMNMKDIIDPIN